MYARAAHVYRDVDLESAPKTQIVERLFERFARDASAARDAIAARDIHAKAAAIDHAMRIAIELRAALDHAAAPELADQLSALYQFVVDKLGEASAKLDVPALDAAASIMKGLGDAFRGAHEALK